MDIKRFFELSAARHEIQDQYHKLWAAHDIDAILTPPAPHTAVPLDEWLSISYTCIWNLMDYPACIIPTGRVRSSDLKDDLSEAKHGGMDKQTYAFCESCTHVRVSSPNLKQIPVPRISRMPPRPYNL